MTIDIDPRALAYLRARATYVQGSESYDNLELAVREWDAAGCPIEATDPDRAGFVRVRIAVATTANGEWVAGGISGCSDDLAARQVRGEANDVQVTFVEAWVPKPAAPETVEGEVGDGE